MTQPKPLPLSRRRNGPAPSTLTAQLEAADAQLARALLTLQRVEAKLRAVCNDMPESKSREYMTHLHKVMARALALTASASEELTDALAQEFLMPSKCANVLKVPTYGTGAQGNTNVD